MKIIISGYGRMGKEVERLATSQGHEVIHRLDSVQDWQAARSAIGKADVVIDFSWPDSALANIRRAFDVQLPMVTGTTGWYDEMPQARQWCEEEGQALFVAANFNIGVNVMLHLAENMAHLLDRFPDYHLSIEEIHHVHKKDSPSGTAIRLADSVISQMKALEGWTLEGGGDKTQLNITSRREGEVPGTHILRADSQNDSLELIHHAKNRKGFATGAMRAAEWIQGKHGFFTMKDLLEFTD